MELLTQSKYRAYRNCPRYFFNRYERRLRSRLDKEGLRRGGAFGSCLFAVQQAEENGTLDLLQEAGPTRRQAVRAVIAECLDTIYAEKHPANQEEHDELELERVKIEVMARAYVAHHGIDRRREVVYELTLRNPASGGHSKTFRRAGKIDGVIAMGNKHARIIEDKFTGQIQKVMISKLPLDTQIAEYVDALAERGWTAEVEYRHTRYPGINPMPPKEYKTKPNYPGESLDEFTDRLTIDVKDRLDFYFDTQVLLFSAEHLEEIRNERWRTATSIIESRAMLREGLPLAQAFPRYTGHCQDWGGCEFIPLCTHQDGAEDLYVVEETDTPELQRS